MVETQYYSRLPKTLELTKGGPSYDKVGGFSQPTDQNVRQAIYSADGKYFAYSIPTKGVSIVDPDTGSVVQTLTGVNDAVEIGFSPKSTYILTWERPKKDEASGNFHNNLKVWKTETGELVESFLQKPQRPWSIQYTNDEKYCARLVTTGLMQFYENNNFRNPYAKLNVEGMTEFMLSPGQNHSVAVYIPVKAGKPAAVRVYNIPNFNQPVSQKTFFKADKVTMKWNNLGTSLLVLASTDVDQTGKSYYGETNLYLLSIAGAYDSRIELDKEGTIHAVEWSPNAREFGVVYGTMPAKTAIFDARGNTVHTFPAASRNSLFYSPHNGRFLAVAGFGNLQGSMDIYDRQKQFAKIATIEAANTVVCQWSPDARYILTATTSPRLRVDNGVRIWHHTGKLIYAVDHEELLGVGWRPMDCNLFPMRNSVSPAPEPHKSVQTVKSIKPPTSGAKAGAYRPPHARVAGVTVAPQSLHDREASSSKPYKAPGASRTIPGAAPAKPVPGAAKDDSDLSKAAAKNKKKRENKKNKADDEENIVNQASTAASSASSNAPTGSSPEEKKTRALLKKLRAIEELKMRQANGDKLEKTQEQKITTEDTIRQELAQLGWKE